MKKFAVTIEATVRKTLTVEAETKEEAITFAHEAFTTSNEEDEPEKYDEECLNVEEIKA